MASALAGKYQHDRDEHLVEYYKALGLPDEEVQKYKTPWRTNEIVVDGNSVTITTNIKVTFKLDQEFDEILANGHKLRSIAHMEGGKLVLKSKAPDGRTGIRTYELNNNELVITMASEKFPVVGKMIYKRV